MQQPRYPIIRPTIPDAAGLAAEFAEILQGGIVTVGPRVAAFERECAARTGAADCVAVSSCTSGLILAARALGLTGEVIVPAFTFAASAHALVWCGLRPVFCDSQPGTLNIDPDHAARLVSDRTSAIMPVYIFGLPPDFDRLLDLAGRRGLRLLCDAAQGLGATYRGRPAGGFGDAEVFSLSPTKVVTAVEGGIVAVRDAGLARKLRSLRDYGKAADGCDMEAVGLSARMSELHAAVGRRCLAHCDELIAARAALVGLYRERLAGLAGVSFQTIPADRTTSHNYMVIFIGPGARRGRDEAYALLADAGIQTKKYFHPAVHEMTAYRASSAGLRGTLPVAERASREGLALPLYSHMTAGDVEIVAGEMLRILG
ncbi:MAG TPA: DegT/DnrJ/EryC1/StrS family aminotransferase [Planctomycetota bacterium]|nr:DegT/DnrJ/EryC1/StrS family aminotransferase [Planctomycetota bacterium]